MFRRTSTPSMWQEMDRLQREMNRLFNDFQPTRLNVAPSFPAMNIWTNEEGQVITAEIPGVDIEDIEITVTGETLTLSGIRKNEELDESARYHRQERGQGKFKRSLQLPFSVQTDKVNASLEKGVLNISLPRAEEDKPKKITVKSLS